jgi:hypothetical protein
MLTKTRQGANSHMDETETYLNAGERGDVRMERKAGQNGTTTVRR